LPPDAMPPDFPAVAALVALSSLIGARAGQPKAKDTIGRWGPDAMGQPGRPELSVKEVTSAGEACMGTAGHGV
jgi:hypothetical protein